jgi:hypothetical protein
MKVIRILLLTTVLVVSASLQTVIAQSTGNITGTVLDDASKSPLNGAQVQVLGTTIDTVTERGGLFFVSGVPEGSVTVRVSYIGLAPREVVVPVEAGKTAVTEVVWTTFSSIWNPSRSRERW